jgi:DNA-directed RNA polymerase subunit RPC12/RpoP
MQIINNMGETALCSQCGQDLTILGSFTYIGVTTNTATQKSEKCQCKNCGHHFLLQYQYFDSGGHVNSFIFNGDINDLTYNWQDQLTSKQKKSIGDHLRICDTCMKKMTDEALSDAWLASLLHEGPVKKSP